MGLAYYDCKIAYGGVFSNNISQLTMIDENCTFPIFTGASSPITGDYTFEEFAEMMTPVYGNGYFMMDGAGGISDFRLQQGKLWLPNLNNIFGTVNAFINNGGAGSGNVIWIIIPKMHRVLRGSSDSLSNISSIFTLNSDGSFYSTSGSGNIYNLFPTITSGQVFNWFHSYGETVNDFKNPTNWDGRYDMPFNVSDPITKRSLTKSATSISQSVLTALFGDAEEPEIPSEDPYAPGGESEPDGGEGDFDDTSDPVDFPDLPELSAVDTGFITLYNPSLSELQSLSSYMWSVSFDISMLKKMFADPMDAILGLSIVPVAVPNAGQTTVMVGNIATTVTMNKAASQYVSLDCGSLNVKEFWGAYLDYSPYTKAYIYLPFIGTHSINADDIMNKSVHVKYNIDILSGACSAFVKCGESVLYQFIGQCGASIPITGRDFTNVLNGVLSIAGSIGSMAATGGISAPSAAGTIAQAAVNIIKPEIEKSGAMAGMGGMLGIQKPYLILTRPRQSLPAGQNQYKGYPSNITKKLSDCSGYTEVESIHMDNIPCTENELKEIEDLLKSGVIF